MNCQFLEPVNLGSTTESWAFSKLECGLPTTTELIVNPDYPERNFFIDKTFNYGDIAVLWFLTLFSVGLIASLIFNYFWKK